MPAHITHYLLAKRLEKKLIENNIEYNQAALYWGSQGPDFLYYHKATRLFIEKNLRKLGVYLHKSDPIKIFDAMKEYIYSRCSQKEKTFAKSYAYGFLAHLALDSIAHPYIYFNQNLLARQNGEKPGFMHHKIEHSIDTIMLERELDKSVNKFRLGKTLPLSFKAIKAQSRMMAFAINKIGGNKKFRPRTFRWAFYDCRFLVILSKDTFGLKRRLAQWIENKRKLGQSLSCFINPITPDEHWDYVNQNKAVWTYKEGARIKKSDDTFYDLFEKAVEQAFEFISRFKFNAEHNQPLYFLYEYKFNNGYNKTN